LRSPPQKKKTSAVDVWKNTFYIAKEAIGSFDEWTLLIEQPVAPLQQAIYDRYKVQLIWIFSFLILTLSLLGYFHNFFFESLARIQDISSKVPEKIKSGQAVEWPETKVLESTILIGNFKQMLDMITGLFQEINESNMELDRRVEERTKELKNSNEELQNAFDEIKTLRGILPICSICKKIRNDEGFYEQIEAYIHKHTGVDFSHTICNTCLKEHYPEEYEGIMLMKKNKNKIPQK
ncbi:MAG: hypothetical protein D3910_21480, partial [Candidatus Electrothrix sp. ATG2]|nr:hypothetical protein [Candidatus Electrothrix sp. ATG2]